MNDSVRLLGVRIDSLTLEEVLARIETFIQEGQPRQIVTVNPEFVITAQENPSFRQALEEADVALADGVGITWAARLLGTPLRARLPGADLVWELAKTAAHRGYRLFLLGGTEGVAEGAQRGLEGEKP